MVTVDAAVQNEGEKYFLDIAFEGDTVRIPISEDNPNKVKSAFNRLIERIRLSEFVIDLPAAGEDLFSQVAKEYVAQLNREIHEVRAEMKKFNLLGDTPPEPE